MKSLRVLAMFMLSQLCLGNFIVIDITVDPIVTHESTMRDGDYGLYDVVDEVLISIPATTLLPGNVLRVNCMLNRGLKIEHASILEISLFLEMIHQRISNDHWSSINVNDTASVYLTQQYGYSATSLTTTIGCMQSTENFHYIFAGIFDFYKGDFSENAILKSISFYFQMPETLDTSMVPSDLYSGTIGIVAARNGLTTEVDLLTTVPEPTTLILLFIGVCNLRLQNRAESAL